MAMTEDKDMIGKMMGEIMNSPTMQHIQKSMGANTIENNTLLQEILEELKGIHQILKDNQTEKRNR